MTAADINDAAEFFVELVSRAREFAKHPVHVHFVTDFSPEKKRRGDSLAEFLPFLRTVLFEAAQNIVPNPRTTLCVHTPPARGNAADIFKQIAAGVQPDDDEFFIIALGKSAIRREAAKGFTGLTQKDRRRLTLFYIPLEMGAGRAAMNALAAAVRILLRGEHISVGPSGWKILQGKT